MDVLVMNNLLFDIIIEVTALEILKQYSTFELQLNIFLLVISKLLHYSNMLLLKFF